MGGHSEIGEPISFADGSTTLSGSLLIPSGPGPHPAFVAIEGSGGASYRLGWMEGYFPFWKDVSEFLVERGYAVLLFDKPGVNESSGDWRRQSFDDRALEVISAMHHLAGRDDIDAGRIDLVGHSQGGWIAQIAAARHPDEVGFLILLAGPAISVRQQIRDDVVNAWTCRGISGFSHAIRRSGVDLGLGMLSLISHMVKPGYLSRIIHFDPRHDLPDIQQPTLALFAEHDPLVVPGPRRWSRRTTGAGFRGWAWAALETQSFAEPRVSQGTSSPSSNRSDERSRSPIWGSGGSTGARASAWDHRSRGISARCREPGRPSPSGRIAPPRPCTRSRPGR